MIFPCLYELIKCPAVSAAIGHLSCFILKWDSVEEKRLLISYLLINLQELKILKNVSKETSEQLRL